MTDSKISDITIGDTVSESLCYICYESSSALINPCKCKGTNYGVHQECLEKWIKLSKHKECLVCNYKYKYGFVYNPSFRRFMLSCVDFKNLKFSKDPQILLISIFIHCAYFILITMLISFIDIIRIDIVLPVFSLLLIIKLCVLKCLDKSLNLIKIIKYSQIFFTVIFYSYLLTRLTFDYHYCFNNCDNIKKICDDKCSYFEEYNNSYNIYCSGLAYQGLIMSIVFLVDLFQKIKKGVYVKKILPFNLVVINNNQYISGNQVLPID